jgi:hypothetical protein
MATGLMMGRKKTGDELKLGVAKIERDIITKAKLIAADRGIPLASYLSESLRSVVDKDWLKMIRKADEAAGN